jgi:hypothetical protein
MRWKPELIITIDFERDPLVEPASGCPNPNATTTIKCVFWGNEIDANLATNFGERREDFQVLIAGTYRHH